MEQINPHQYDAGAAKFAAHMESQPYNVLYERPATLALIGDVTGLQVLDVACGAGSLLAEMLPHAETVVGIDSSAEILRLARERVGPGVGLHHQDCSEPFDWAEDNSFDLIVMSLALHYVNDRDSFLSEMHRVLRPDGAFVISTHHPTDDWRRLDGSYFSTDTNTDYWASIGQNVSSWRMPLSHMTAQFTDAGFLIEQLVEPRPVPEMAESNPEVFAKLEDCPAFILFRLIQR